MGRRGSVEHKFFFLQLAKKKRSIQEKVKVSTFKRSDEPRRKRGGIQRLSSRINFATLPCGEQGGAFPLLKGEISKGGRSNRLHGPFAGSLKKEEGNLSSRTEK